MRLIEWIKILDELGPLTLSATLEAIRTGKERNRVFCLRTTGRWPAVLAVTLLALSGGCAVSLANEGGQRAGKVSFRAESRLRYEYQDDFNAKCYGDQPKRGNRCDGFLLGRFRFVVDYSPDETVHLSLGLQDSEVWDSAFDEGDFYSNKFNRQHNPYTDKWELHDTYVEIRDLLPLGMKVGRQAVTYGNARIFGPGHWSNTGRWTWDLARVSYRFAGGFADAFYGMTVIRDPNELSLIHRHGYESFGAYAHFELPQEYSGITLEPFAMTKADRHDKYLGEGGRLGEFNSYYVGARAFRKDYKSFDVDFTFVNQQGDYSDDDVDAYAYHLLAGYRFRHMGYKPRLSLEYSYASGDGDPTDGRNETFDGAFGARAKILGRMNLFYWMNIEDAQVNLEISPTQRLSFRAEYHQFRLAERKDAWYLNAKEYRDKTGSSGDEVGDELDIVGSVKLPRANEIQLGFGHFWPDEFAKALASDAGANWVFLQWAYKFSYPLP